MSTRAERMAYVRRVRLEIETDEILNPPRPTTQAQRKRIVEVLAIESGLPPPRWRDAPRERPGPIDDTPWRESRQASLRAQHERFGRYGLALAHDGSLFCTRCREIVHAIPRNRPFAMGTPVSALALRHAEATGCR